MAARHFILFPNQSAWTLCEARAGAPTFMSVAVSKSDSPEQTASRVAAQLAALGYAGGATILAVPSTWCFSASISTADLPRHDVKAMTYRLEEKLPIAAESFVADFMPVDENIAFGVAIATSQVRPYVDALEAKGVAIHTITPAVLLAVQGMDFRRQGTTDSVLLCTEPGANDSDINVVGFRQGVPLSWATVPLNSDDLKLQLDLVALELDVQPEITSCGIDSAMLNSVTDRDVPPQIIPGTPGERATRAGSSIIAGRDRPWIQLRRGELAVEDPLRSHRRPINMLVGSLAVLLLIVAGILFLRGEQHARSGKADERQMLDAFNRQFPGWATPANIRAVVESEHRKAIARSGGSLPAEATGSALRTLHDVLMKLPAEGHFTIDRMTFEDVGFQMEGRLRSYEDVDAVAAAARQAGLAVEAPQARREPDGSWTFTLHGSRVATASAAIPKGTPG